jgi:ABC-type multidrug transport system permease subunit
MASPLIELTRARFLEFWRDPSALFWVFVFPVILAVALGLAFREKGDEAAKVALVGELAPHLVGEDTRTGGALELIALSRDEALMRLSRGLVDLVVELPVALEPQAKIAFHFDPTKPGSSKAYLEARELLERKAGRHDVLVAVPVHVSKPASRYIDFLIPGLVGLNIMGSCMWGLGYTVVDSRRRKLLKRFAVTPMRRADFLLSFGLSRLVFLVLEVAFLVLFGWLVFGVAVRGSILGLVVVSFLGLGAFTGLALLIASRTESVEAAAGWMNFVQLPMWLLSGSFFDYTRFPEVTHPFIKALPLTALNDALRAVVNQGAGLDEVWPQAAILALVAALSFVMALRMFRWQ